MMKHSFFGLGALVVGMLFATTAFASNVLVGTTWNLTSYDGTSAEGAVEFTDTMVYSKFCNNVSQGYVYSSGTIVASGAGMSTMMYCEGLPMTMETNFRFDAPATVLLSGTELTITTDAKHVFVFEQDMPMICTLQYEPVCGEDGMTYGNACAAAAVKVAVVSEGVCPSDATCVQKFDGCNTCMRMPGEDEWACTKIYCETPTNPYCLATAEDEDMLVGDDADEHGCLGSAGYSWSQSTQACIRIWENTGATSLEVAYDFAFNNGMTTMETMVAFRAEDFITRQEAAKMLVSFMEHSKGDVYSGGESNTCVDKYTDAASFDYSLKSFIAAACGYGMMQGAANGTLFMPNNAMTQGEALAILMRSLDGWQAEPDTNERWMPYVLRAKEANIISFDTTALFNRSISRGDLIKMAHTIYLNVQASQ